MYEKRLLTRYMNYPIFVKVVHLLQNVWKEVAYWVYEWSHFCQSVVHLLHDVWTEVAYWAYELPNFCQCGTFVAKCMKRGCLLGVWMIPFLSKWYICCMMYEQRLLTGHMNDPIFVKVVHLLHHSSQNNVLASGGCLLYTSDAADE